MAEGISRGYYRLHGRYENGRIIYRHSYSDEELKKIRERVLGWNCGEGFVFFNNSDMCRDARRFGAMMKEV
ncbi:DUF72 domain-containing protein [Thermococcus sp. 18S1]|uniref:DUF72 domain-containing protein n=1 Tax=Thermococcus sp. 18S1 TaxID=1638210 RepID=UPI0037437B4D